METFNWQRLDLARQRRGLTKVALATTIGVSSRMITAYESGDKQPSPLTIDRMATALRFPREFFLGDDLDEPTVEGVSFRAMSKLTVRQRNQARASATLARTLIEWVELKFNLPAPQVPQYEGVDPETAAIAVRNEWGLGEQSIKNVMHTLEAHGVRIFSLPEECSSVDAFAFWDDATPYIFLNTVKSAEHRRMDAAHELGHLVLHHKGSAHGREAEREAADFASAFLMPQAAVLADAPRDGTLPGIVLGKKRWGVSVAALTYRMHALGLLTDFQYRNLFVEMSVLGYRKREPNPMRPEQSKLLAILLRAIRTSGVTVSQLARELRLHQPDLSSLLFGLVFTSIEGNGTGRQTASERPQLRVV